MVAPRRIFMVSMRGTLSGTGRDVNLGNTTKEPDDASSGAGKTDIRCRPK
jgi:hypothetical protein